MDEMMLKTAAAADVRTKWRVKTKTKAWRKPGHGDLGFIAPGFVFYSNWIKDGYISINSQRWVVASACEMVVEEAPEGPAPETNLYRLLTDLELPQKYLKKERSNVPQTVRFAHYGNGSIKYTDDLIDWMLALNGGIVQGLWESIADTYNRKGEKFYAGERKYPLLGFAGNIHRVKNRVVWAGGLGIAKGVTVLELDVLSPDFLPAPQFVIDTPYQIQLNTVANKQTRRYPQAFTPRVALISPVPLYIEEARCVAVAEYKPLFE